MLKLITLDNLKIVSEKIKALIPKKTSQLENDSDFVTSTYVDEKIANAITTILNTAV